MTPVQRGCLLKCPDDWGYFGSSFGSPAVIRGVSSLHTAQALERAELVSIREHPTVNGLGNELYWKRTEKAGPQPKLTTVQMPSLSFLVSVGSNFIKKDIRDWLNENTQAWYHRVPRSKRIVRFTFGRHDDAVLFMLRWGTE